MSSIAALTAVIQLSVPAGTYIRPSVLQAIRESTALFGQRLIDRAVAPVTSPAELLNWEEQLHASVPRECIDPVTGAMLSAAMEDPVVNMKAQSLLDSYPQARLQKEDQKVTIDLLGGGKVSVRTPYFLQRPVKKKESKAKKKQRGKAGNGLYPALAVLGIHERLTPAYASLLTREVIRGSLDEAKEVLAYRGVERDRKAIQRVVNIVSRRALAYQKRQMERGAKPTRPTWNLKGKRIGILVDGGRVRVRTKKRGRKRASGWKSFATDWKEPRVIAVYELDEKGRKSRRGYVRYDSMIASAAAVFAHVASLLRELGAEQADLWVLGGDGATWIWNDRGTKLAESLGYDPTKVIEVLDFYHAVEYLAEFASHREDWSEAQQKEWVTKMRKQLKKGAVERIVAEMRPLCGGSNVKDLARVMNRFEKNKERMRYNVFRERHIPCGSGVVESAVRRIVNLRLKGAGIFWKEATANGLLHLRARYLSGGWNEYITQIFAPESEQAVDSLPIEEKIAA